jgi:site-specific recombinase XerD
MNTENAIKLLRNTIRRKHLAYSTEDTYCHWLVQYLRFIKTVPAGLASEQKIERWLTSLALKDVSASTQNQAFNAILFFYRACLGRELSKINALRAKRGERVRRAPSIEEVRQLIAAVTDADGYPTRLMVKLLYGCGLRISEACNLRIRDVDPANSLLVIRGAKGNKDRVVALPCSLAEPMRAQIAFALTIAEQDKVNRLPVKLPNRVAQKYPSAQFSRQWAFVFPLRNACRDPRGGQLVRYRMLECTIQRAVRRACVKLDNDIKPHELRHAYATHNINRGVNLKALSEAMGHKQITTTAGYCHANALSVPSPLEAIPA